MKKLTAIFLMAALLFGQLTVAFAQQPYSGQAKEKQKENPHTVGWLAVPGTEINVPVVQSVEDNVYYLRRNFEGKTDFDGWYFIDYRWQAGDGTRSSISMNTVIYGNSSDEDPGGSRFSQLKAYRDEEFAMQHPYIYFSTAQEDMVWEVFAVSVVDVTLPYNLPEMDDETINSLRRQSLHPFSEVTVSTGDKLLTLSTTDFSINSAFPNDNRFVVMAKLVQSPISGEDNPGTGTKTTP